MLKYDQQTPIDGQTKGRHEGRHTRQKPAGDTSSGGIGIVQLKLSYTSTTTLVCVGYRTKRGVPQEGLRGETSRIHHGCRCQCRWQARGVLLLRAHADHNYCCRAETKNVFSRPFSLRCVNKRSDHYYYCCSGHKPDDKNKHNSCHGSFDRLPAAKSSTETSRQNRRQRGRIKSSHVKSCHQPSTRLATSVASPKEPASTAIRPPGDDKKKNAKTTATQLWCKPTLLSYGRAIYPQVVLQVAFLGPQTGSQGVGQLPEQHRRLHQT